MYSTSIDPSNGLSFFQIEALKKLSSDGLTAAHLQQWHAKEAFFGSRHTDALIYLIRSRSLSPEKAVAEICDLGPFQVEQITDGLKRDEVHGLNNWQIFSIAECKKYGLTPTHLRNWKGEPFGPYHNAEIHRLMKNQHLSPDEALVKLSKTRFSR